MEQMFGGLAKRAETFAIVAMLMTGGLVAGSALGSGFAYSPAVAQEGEGDGEGDSCENDHCGRVDVRWWFDRDACLPNGDEETACDATDEHGNCGDTGCYK
jgi:hypothetical protein